MSCSDSMDRGTGIDNILKARAKLDDILRRKHGRQVVVFFCDLKGFTSFTETHGDIAARILVQRMKDVVVPALSENGGHLVKIIGDAVMAWFDDPAQALKAAVTVQNGARKMNTRLPAGEELHLRVGMNLGEVIFDNGDLYGDAVNIAARIESEAPTDGILISHSLYRAVGGAGCRPAKKVLVKGKSRPLRLYQVLQDGIGGGTYPESLSFRRFIISAIKSRKRLPVYGLAAILLLAFAAAAGVNGFFHSGRHPVADPYNAGYLALRLGDTLTAAADFGRLAKDDPRSLETKAALSFWNKDYQMAEKLLDEALVKAGDRIYINALEGEILIRRSDMDGAEASFARALRLQKGLVWHRARAFNGLGRIQAGKDRQTEALASFNEAARLAPDDPDILANRGVLLERIGERKQAMESYRQALQFDPRDPIAAQRLPILEHRLQIAEDKERRLRIERLCAELVRRYREEGQTRDQHPAGTASTAGPPPVWLTAINEAGDLPAREGEPELLTDLLYDDLQDSGRMQLVERDLLESLLAELRLGSSELAAPSTALRLGRLLAARIIISGRLYRQGGRRLVNLKLIEVETSRIRGAFSLELKENEGIPAAAHRVAEEILLRLGRLQPAEPGI